MFIMTISWPPNREQTKILEPSFRVPVHTHTHVYIVKEMRWIQASDHRQTIDEGDEIETLGLSTFNRKSKLKFGINGIKFKTMGNGQ